MKAMHERKKFSGDDCQTMVFGDAIGMQEDLLGRREDPMTPWAERLGNGSFEGPANAGA